MRTQPANQTAIHNAPSLAPEQLSDALTPDTEVVILFRGGPPIVDKWDFKDYVIPPLPRDASHAPTVSLEDWQSRRHPASYWKLKYAVALHLRERNIVPATRNPHTGHAISQLAIVHTPNGKMLDPADRHAPFTDEQMKHFDFPEGLDRTMYEDDRRNVTLMSTEEALAQAMARGRDVNATLEAEPDEDATAPPAVHEGLAEVRLDESEAGRGVSRTRAGKTRFKDES